jgi:hypothetical protein
VKFNGLALLPLLILFLPVARHIALQAAQEIACLLEEFRLRRKLRKLNPADPTVPDLLARLASINL